MENGRKKDANKLPICPKGLFLLNNNWK